MCVNGKEPNKMKRRYFVFDAKKCIGCFNCLHACKDEHVGNDFSPITLPQKLHQQYWLTTTELVRGQFPTIDVSYLTEPCGHCEDAPCLTESSGVIFKRDDGVILIDPIKAKGAGDLSALCPFGKISYNEEQDVSQKCTFCAHLLDEGWEQPRCAQACPLGAIKMEYVEPEIIAERVDSGELSQLGEKYLEYGSSLYIKNIEKIKSLFIAGKLLSNDAGQEVCAEGLLVKLYKEDDLLQTLRSDVFGEYKFDGLVPGEYSIEISDGEKVQHSFSINVENSISLKPLKGFNVLNC